jgi:uncharacterized OB-fold protein
LEVLTIDKFYAEGKLNSKLLGLRCKNGHITTPPRHSCRICNSLELSIVELSGRGKIVSFTKVFAKSKDFPLEAPYVLVLVKLDEGPNLLGILNIAKLNEKSESGERNAQVSMGDVVKVRFREIVENSLNGHSATEKWPRIFFRFEGNASGVT